MRASVPCTCVNMRALVCFVLICTFSLSFFFFYHMKNVCKKIAMGKYNNWKK